MARFNNPTDYTGARGSSKHTGSLRLATAAETAAGTNGGIAISPLSLASAVGDLVPSATTSIEGVVLLTDNHSPVATKFYADALAIAGSPVATETTAGIGQLATDAEAIAGTPSTGALALFVTPSNLAAVLAAGGPGSFTTLDASGAVTFSSTGAISMTSDTASLFDVTGAGIDLTLSSDAGRVIVNGEEAAANAVTIVSAAGGVDLDAALQVNIASSQSAVDAIRIVASAGGIDVDAVGTAGEDINITNTGASVVIVATESAADAIVINATLGGIDILASGASAGEDIDIVATGSSVNITSTENNAGAILITANGGTSERVTLISTQGTGADSLNLTSTAGGCTVTTGLNNSNSIYLHANAGTSETIKIHSDLGTGVASINVLSDVGGVTVQSGLGSADAINLNASDAGGGIDIDSGTAGIIVDTTGAISLDAAAASNLTVTGAFALDLISTLGKVSLQSGQSAADSVEIKSLIGGIDILAVGAAAGEDIDIVATGSSVNIQATESDVNAITINASGVAGGVNMDAGTSGVIVDTTGAISLDAAAASNLTVTGAFALDVITTLGKLSLQSGQSAADSLEIKSLIGGIDILAVGAAAGEDIDIIATGSSVNISATESAADSITIVSTAGGIDIFASGAAAGEDIDIISTGSSVNISATESAADSITIVSTAGGIDIFASGAAAGEDIDIVATGSSVNITATENVSDAIVINASGAASGMSLDCGTAGLTIGTGMKHAVTSVATAATPYTVLGTDYVISTDTTAGVLTLTLPATPGTGRTLVIYDGVGQAAIGGAITIDGNGNNIAASGTSAATKAINTAYESYTLYFNGILWLGQNVV